MKRGRALSNSNLENAKKYFRDSTNLNEDSEKCKQNVDISSESFKDELNLNDSFEDFDVSDSEFNEEIIIKKNYYGCKVNKVQEGGNIKIVTLKNSEEITEIPNVNVKLCGFWYYCNIKEDDCFNLIDARQNNDSLTITNEYGIIIVNPDWLIPVTTLTQSYYCERQSVFDTYFGANFTSNQSMVMGNIIHALFQQCARIEGLTLGNMKNVADRLLRSKKFLMQIYETEINMDDLRNNIYSYCPNIKKWIEDNILRKKLKCLDIEESIWCSKYGLKGNIDMTLSESNEDNQVVVPVELKTGKISFSEEHRAQILLYVLMASEKRKNDKVKEGILLYVKYADFKRFEIVEDHIKSLLGCRNKIAKNLRNFSIDGSTLPPVLNRPSMCQNCSRRVECSLFVGKSNTENIESEFYQKSINHLNLDDIDLFYKFVKLLLLENSDRTQDLLVNDIVTKQNTKGVRQATLVDCFEHNDMFNFEFKYDPSSNPNVQLNKNKLVIVSTEDGTNLALLSGYVTDCESLHHIRIVSEKKSLDINNKDCTYRIDLTVSSSLKSNMSTMVQLMGKGEIEKRIRSLLLGNYEYNHNINKKVDVHVDELNENQNEAVSRCINCSDFILVKGYPGSGKSVTIGVLIQQLVKMRKTVLLSTYTHNALEHVMSKLDRNINFLIVDCKNVRESLREKTLDHLLETINYDPIELQERIKLTTVVGVTCLSANHSILRHKKFDYVIIDEAGQITIPTTILPLLKLHDKGVFAMFGDQYQLPPLVKQDQARNEGLEESLFEYLDNNYKTVTELKLQYRMNEKMLELCNNITYNNRIGCATDAVKDYTLANLIATPSYEENVADYLKKCGSLEMKDSVVLVNIKNQVNDKDESTNRLVNMSEANIVVNIIEFLQKIGVREDDIGVITPFNAQVDALKASLEKSIEVNTIDRYQGKEKKIIIISFVKSQSTNGKDESKVNSKDILEDKRRLNVAITRARCKLILVGDWNYLRLNYLILNKISNIASNSISV